MTRAEAKRIEQKKTHEEVEVAVNQAGKVRDRAIHALMAFRAKYDLRPWDTHNDPELQATYLQLNAAYETTQTVISDAYARKLVVLATVPKPYLVKRWYEPPLPDDEE